MRPFDGENGGGIRWTDGWMLSPTLCETSREHFVQTLEYVGCARVRVDSNDTLQIDDTDAGYVSA
jgi:hypothetical protein